MKTIIVLVVALTLALVGAAVLTSCSKGGPPSADDAMSSGVKLITLPDGTRCAVAYGGQYGRPSGVDCDWKPTRVER